MQHFALVSFLLHRQHKHVAEGDGGLSVLRKHCPRLIKELDYLTQKNKSPCLSQHSARLQNTDHPCLFCSLIPAKSRINMFLFTLSELQTAEQSVSGQF